VISPAVLHSNFLVDICRKDLEKILASGRVKRFKAKQAIVTRGEHAQYLFILLSGRVRYYKITRQGDEVVFRWLLPGDTFGLGSLLKRPTPYMGTAEALRDGEVLVWSHAKMRTLVALHPQLSENALKVVLQYLRDYANRHSRLVTKSAEERLADVLLILGHQQGRVWGGRVELEATNEQLSALADVSLFTTSRNMSKWARRGFISKERGKVFIRAPEGLVAD
jgi:CRP-like cAMP-binding protein